MARGIHLFPSRTEKLSLATPMVLRNSGRVGSRRLWLKTPVHFLGRESFVFKSLFSLKSIPYVSFGRTRNIF